MRAAGAALAGGLLAGTAWAEQPLTLEVMPDDGTQFAVRCMQADAPVIEHAGDQPQRFGFDAGPVDCRIRIVGEGAVDVEATGPETRTQLRASGENPVVTVTLP